MPAGNLTDSAPSNSFAHLDSTIVLERAIGKLGIYPAVDTAKRQFDEEIEKDLTAALDEFRSSSNNLLWRAFETSAGASSQVQNTAQITKAMQMVAASKMRKAQEAALNGRPYAFLLNRVLVSLRNRLDQTLHPLLEKREVKNELVVLLSTDKGLCGGLNTNLLREVTNFNYADYKVPLGRT